MRRLARLGVLLALAALPCCSDSPAPADGGEKAAECASAFGKGLSTGFGRLDGTVLAVVGPGDRQCRYADDNHLILEVTAKGAAYRVSINVEGDGRNGTDRKIRYRTTSHPLVGTSWSEGWHTGGRLDYAGDLGARSETGFSAYGLEDAVATVTDRLELGAKVSVYSTAFNSEGSHLVHRDGGRSDGAIVLDPDGSSPTWLLFHFDGQTF